MNGAGQLGHNGFGYGSGPLFGLRILEQTEIVPVACRASDKEARTWQPQ